MNQILHTPEGVRDIYNRESAAKQGLEKRLFSTISSYGYDRIFTPSFEYFDIFGKEIGSTASNELYKFFDREGNTLVLRPDMTPQIARACANYFNDESGCVRLYYCGSVFKNPSRLLGRLRESTQIGAEFIGEKSIDADAEIVALSCDALSAAGLDTFKISIGHIGYFDALTKACGLDIEKDADTIDGLFSYIRNKNFFGLEETLKNLGVSGNLMTLFAAMGKFYGSPDEWQELIPLAQSYPDVVEVLDYLSRLYEMIRLYSCSEHVSFELGLLTDIRYYTGIVLAGYTFGSGEPVLSGGRYDRLHGYFGTDRPAVGFAIREDELMVSLERQGIEPHIKSESKIIEYSSDNMEDAIKQALEYRKKGVRVTLRKNEND